MPGPWDLVRSRPHVINGEGFYSPVVYCSWVSDDDVGNVSSDGDVRIIDVCKIDAGIVNELEV